MTKISATILTYNEAERIKDCLESLRDIADEIIVVDSGSTDSTLDVCRRYGCKISRRELAGFGAQRQYATSLTTHSYVLAIDADEEISPALRRSLIALKTQGLTHRVYAFSRLNFYCGFAVRHCGWYPDTQIRLFDKRYANWNLRDVAERVIFRDSVRPSLVEGDILHYRCRTPAEYRDTMMAQADLKARVIAAGRQSVSPLTPRLRALRSFLSIYLRHGGILDGPIGLAISKSQARATCRAYSAARKLLKENTI